jgi:hypothetical protein
MTIRTTIAIVAFTVLWIAGVGAVTRVHAHAEMTRLRGAAANVWLQVIRSARL